jgi:DNA-directed RNA polymerase II subunit RPB2
MVRSLWCSLLDKTPQQRIEMGECEHDQGGYFIIKGSEKVVVGQERDGL